MKKVGKNQIEKTAFEAAIEEVKDSMKRSDIVASLMSTVEAFYVLLKDREHVMNVRNGIIGCSVEVYGHREALKTRDVSWLDILGWATLGNMNEIWEIFRVMWSESNDLPTGVSVMNARKKRGHVSFGQIEEIRVANLVAARFLQLVIGSSPTMVPDTEHPQWLLAVEMMGSKDSITRSFACTAVLQEVAENTCHPIELAKHVLPIAIGHLLTNANSFYECGDDLVWTDKSIVYTIEEVKSSEAKFNKELFKVTHVDDENNLDLALMHFVEDEENGDLAAAYHAREALRAKLKDTKNRLNRESQAAMCLLATIRCLAIILAQCMSNVLELPAAAESSLEDFVDHKRARRMLKKNSCIHIVTMVKELPWTRLSVLANLEKRVCYSVSALSVLATSAARLSCSCQEVVLNSFTRDAVINLGMDPGPLWYNKIIPGDTSRKHELNLATRIHTSLCLWTLHKQGPEQIKKCLDITYLGDKMWPNILNKVDERCQKVISAPDYDEMIEYFNDFCEIEAMQGNYIKTDHFHGKMAYTEGVTLEDASNAWDRHPVSVAANTLVNLFAVDGRPWGDSDEWVNGEDDSGDESSDRDDDTGGGNGGDSDSDASGGGVQRSVRASKITGDKERDENESPRPPKSVKKDHRECLDWYLLMLCNGVGSLLDDALDTVKFAYQLCHEELQASRFVQQTAECRCDILLNKSFEGPGQVSSRRGTHPLEMLNFLLRRDAQNTMSEFVFENARMRLPPIFEVFRSEEKYDERTRWAAVEFAARVFMGSRPAFKYPSRALSHRHFEGWFIPKGAASNMARFISDLKLLARQLAIENIYKSRPEAYYPYFVDGACRLERTLSLFQAIASIEPDIAMGVLRDAAESTLPVEVPCEKKGVPEPNPLWATLDEEETWLVPFLLAIKGSSEGIATHFLTVHWWEDEIWDKADLWADIARCSLSVQRHFAELLTIFTAHDPRLNTHIAQEFTPWVRSLLENLHGKDSHVRKSVLWVCTNIVNSAKRPTEPGNTVSAQDVPFDSATNLFRAAMIHQGDALECAVDTVVNASYVWQKMLGVSQEWVNDPNAAEREREADALDPTAEPLPSLVAREEVKNYAPKTLRDAQMLLPPVTPYMEKTDDAATEISSHRSKPPKRKPKSKKSKRKYKEPVQSDENEDGLMSAWECTTSFNMCRSALDAALIAMEFIACYCEGRLEWQVIVRNRSPGTFMELPSFLANLRLSPEGECCKDFFTNETFMSGFHPGVAAAATRTVRSIVRRHAEARVLVCNSGCVEALMDCLTRAIDLDDEELCLQIVLTIEQMIIRNNDTWKYIQATGGVMGLLRLMDRGNTSLRILASSAITLDIQRPGLAGKFFLTDVVQKGVVKVLQKLIVDPDHDVQLSAMVLTKTCMASQLARSQVLEPEFLSELASTLRNPDLAVMRGACEILVILGSEQQTEVRGLMYDQTGGTATQGKDAAAQYLATTIERLVDIVAGKVVSVTDARGGKPEESVALAEKDLAVGPPGTFRREVLSLSNAAANVLAGMTDGDEADWPDGAPPLRETLYKSGVFPEINDI